MHVEDVMMVAQWHPLGVDNLNDNEPMPSGDGTIATGERREAERPILLDPPAGDLATLERRKFHDAERRTSSIGRLHVANNGIHRRAGPPAATAHDHTQQRYPRDGVVSRALNDP